MNLVFSIEFEREAFTSLGSTPSLAISLVLRRGTIAMHESPAIVSLGGRLGIGLRPFRIGWNGRWLYAAESPPEPPTSTEGPVTR